MGADNETGLVLIGHRYYSPGMGRLVNRDPLGYGGGINLYGFTGNNPVNEMDPEGTDALFVFTSEDVSEGLKVGPAATAPRRGGRRQKVGRPTFCSLAWPR